MSEETLLVYHKINVYVKVNNTEVELRGWPDWQEGACEIWRISLSVIRPPWGLHHQGIPQGHQAESQTLFFYDLAQLADTLSQAARSCSAQGRGSSHRRQQHIERVRIVMTYPVDEEGRGTAHSALSPAFGVLVQPIGKNMVL